MIKTADNKDLHVSKVSKIEPKEKPAEKEKTASKTKTEELTETVDRIAKFQKEGTKSKNIPSEIQSMIKKYGIEEINRAIDEANKNK